MSANTQWANYLFHSDFTSEINQLIELPLGPLSEENAMIVASMLASKDDGVGREFWAPATVDQQWQLEGAEIVYNSVNKPSLPTKGKMDNVLILKFPDASVTPAGQLYLCYNNAPATSAPAPDEGTPDVEDPVATP